MKRSKRSPTDRKQHGLRWQASTPEGWAVRARVYFEAALAALHAMSGIRSADQLTGQRFREQRSYSNDPQLDAEIKSRISASRRTIKSLKPPEIKRILRLYDVPPKRILEANTTDRLLSLAESNGIVDVPDEWTLDRLQAERKARQTEAYKAQKLIGVISTKAE
jgi:hypothetical protein